MTWLDLYNFLHTKANDVHRLDSEIWQSEVTIHDAKTGYEETVDSLNIDGKTVLAFNMNSYYNEE